MTKEEWKDSSGQLRKLLRGLNNSNSAIEYRTCYKFGVVFNPRYRFFQVWNGRTNNVIATIKPINGAVVVRYRASSIYRDIITSMKWDDNKMVFMPSNNLRLHKDYARQGIGDSVRRSIDDFIQAKRIRQIQDHYEVVNGLSAFVDNTVQYANAFYQPAYVTSSNTSPPMTIQQQLGAYTEMERPEWTEVRAPLLERITERTEDVPF